ncbi:MAG TPA: c-type cytochrome [Longimicrobiales bacterium]|nr:c-type cytochrome [Longimicrobiales bacterium]
MILKLYETGSHRQRPGRAHYRRRRAAPGPAARPATLLFTLVVLLAAGCETVEVDADGLAALTVPAEHADGAALYETWCQACHGPQATGTDQGPPLVHPVYRTRHHGDAAFQLAVSQGVRAHHFRFGDMPPIPGPDDDDVAAITRYVRWLQSEAGID